MPIYEYVCENCHNELEVLQKISEPKLTECPQCGKSTLMKKTSISAFHLKGGGWYKDGYSVPDGNGDKAGPNGEKTDNTPVKTPTTTETSTVDSKPAAKTEAKPEKPVETKPAKTSEVPSSKAS